MIPPSSARSRDWAQTCFLLGESEPSNVLCWLALLQLAERRRVGGARGAVRAGGARGRRRAAFPGGMNGEIGPRSGHVPSPSLRPAYVPDWALKTLMSRTQVRAESPTPARVQMRRYTEFGIRVLMSARVAAMGTGSKSSRVAPGMA